MRIIILLIYNKKNKINNQSKMGPVSLKINNLQIISIKRIWEWN